MARFDAATAVEELEWDFTKYGGKTGVIPEPQTKQVNDFFKSMKAMVREVKQISKNTPALSLDADNLSEEDMEALSDQIDASGQIAEEYQQRTRELLAELCSNSPNAEDLAVLPQRVLAAFSTWLVGELRPKQQAPATKR